MNATSSYKAATLVERPSVSSIEDIYANATSLQTSPTGLSDDAMESAQGLGGGAGNRVNSIYIFLQDGRDDGLIHLEIPRKDIFEDFDISTQTDWSVSIPIDDLAYNSSASLVFDTNTELNVGTGAGQSIARIPIVRDRKMLNPLGVYKEGLICKSGSPIVEYYKI